MAITIVFLLSILGTILGIGFIGFSCLADMTRKGRIILVVVSIVIIVGSIVTLGSYKKNLIYQKLWIDNLVSINDGSRIKGEISGGIFVVRGYINQNPTFTAYVSAGEGYKLQHYPADKSVVYYTNDKFRAEVWGRSSKYETMKIFGLIEVRGRGEREVDDYKIYVPEGSIVERFELDSEL